MSHVCKISVEVNDLESLQKAAEDLGMEFVEGQKQYRWFGRYVGDYPLPQGFSKHDLGKCDHALRIPGDQGAYEVGVCKARDGSNRYELLWDFWAGGKGLQSKIGKNGERLAQHYSSRVARKHIPQGFRVTTQTNEDGHIVIRAKR